MDLDLANKKYEITNYIQEVFDEYIRQQEVHQQYKDETNLQIKKNIDVFKKQESELKLKDSKILELENALSNKNKTINDYENMIRDLEDKLNEILVEKKEEDRFNIVKVQAKTIQEKENEIERLEELLKKKKNDDPKIEKLIESVEKETNNDSEISIIETQEVQEVQENQEVQEVKETQEVHETKEESDGDDGDDNYEILVYRKKEYWIKKDDNPISVYEIIGDDELGKKIGSYSEGKNGKMKVVLDKK